MTARTLSLIALPNVPEVRPGDDLSELLVEGIERVAEQLHPHDVLVVAQKIVSKSENRFVDLDEVIPSAEAEEWARRTNKDARLVELILRESLGVIRWGRDVLIVEHRLGHIMANAGIDFSNVPSEARPLALLLPRDPDTSAENLRARVYERTGTEVGVLIIDSFGRPFRQGVCGTAIGTAGVASLVDMRGKLDRSGRELRVTQVAVADELAAAASLVMGQAAEGTPAVLARGVPYSDLQPGRCSMLLRPRSEDLFR
ncbi:coenzyme F420-0:L-glutamate ligase [Bradyrhizobium ottawaense]|uniref:coenzyme F420-0:L-glutamate ligase n=1 Tax=Bradyrhizobium ottawaense TaxID=931866 RepID=UPI0038371595